jgi:hypothetical protein
MWNLFQKWPLLINVEEQTSLKTLNVTLMTWWKEVIVRNLIHELFTKTEIVHLTLHCRIFASLFSLPNMISPAILTEQLL